MLSIGSTDSSQRDYDRPFKAYARAPVTLPGNLYTSYAPTTTYSSPSALSMDHPTHIKQEHHAAAAAAAAAAQQDMYPQYAHMHSMAPPTSHMPTTLQPMRNYMDISQLTPRTEPLGMDPHSSVSSTSTQMPLLPPQPQSQGPPPTSSLHSPAATQGSPNGGVHRASPIPSTSADANSNGKNSPETGDEDDFKVPPKKRTHTVPEAHKDGSYWEKRKKNNDSAKRSRDARRMKEEQIAMRVVYLEQENLQLRTEVSLLKSEIEKLRCMLYNS